MKENLEILNIIVDFIKENPNLRFIQALWALGIVDREDRFYEESKQTLKRINEKGFIVE